MAGWDFIVYLHNMQYVSWHYSIHCAENLQDLWFTFWSSFPFFKGREKLFLFLNCLWDRKYLGTVLHACEGCMDFPFYTATGPAHGSWHPVSSIIPKSTILQNGAFGSDKIQRASDVTLQSSTASCGLIFEIRLEDKNGSFPTFKSTNYSQMQLFRKCWTLQLRISVEAWVLCSYPQLQILGGYFDFCQSLWVPLVSHA